ncbi:hypothetical protein XENOCAPTIV_021033, partial [Xenoophorus captivus]
LHSVFFFLLQDVETALRQIRDENKDDLKKKHKDKEVDPLNCTLSFREGEELKLKDLSKERKGWSQRTPQTLLDALANMDINSVYNTVADPEEGAVHRQTEISCLFFMAPRFLVVRVENPCCCQWTLS